MATSVENNMNTLKAEVVALMKSNQLISGLRTQIEICTAELTNETVNKEIPDIEKAKEILETKKKTFEETVTKLRTIHKYIAIFESALLAKKDGKTPSLDVQQIACIKAKKALVYDALMADPTAEKDTLTLIQSIYEQIKIRKQKMDENMPKLEKVWKTYQASANAILMPPPSYLNALYSRLPNFGVSTPAPSNSPPKTEPAPSTPESKTQ